MDSSDDDIVYNFIDEENPYYKETMLRIVITQNKGINNSVFDLYTPEEINNGLRSLFKKFFHEGQKKDIEKFFSFRDGGIFDRDRFFPFKPIDVKVNVATEGLHGNGKRVHWNVDLEFKYIGKLIMWGKENFIYWARVRECVFKYFLGLGLISSEQFENRCGCSYIKENGKTGYPNKGINMHYTFHNKPNPNYSKKEIFANLTDAQISLNQFAVKGNNYIMRNIFTGNVTKRKI